MTKPSIDEQIEAVESLRSGVPFEMQAALEAALETLRWVKFATRPALEYCSEKWAYDPETGWFFMRRNGRVTGSVKDGGYIGLSFKGGRCFPAHWVAWLFLTGTWPTQMVDHINRRRWDNSASNLRLVTPKENSANRSPARESTIYDHVDAASRALNQAKRNRKLHELPCGMRSHPLLLGLRQGLVM